MPFLPIQNKSTNNYHNMKEPTLTRQQLYDLVWSEPISQLAKQYKISDANFRNVCKRMSVPIPLSGHWSKVKYGKPVSVIQLPQNYIGENVVTLHEKTSEESTSDSPIVLLRKLRMEIESDPDVPLKVPEKLKKPDSLITSTMNYHDAVKRYYRTHQGTHPDNIGVLNIRVTEKNKQRAYCIMDTIIKSLRARKHDVKIRYFDTCAVIEGEEIGFRLRERQRVSPEKDQWGGRMMESTGELVFVIDLRAYHRLEVKDGTEGLETKVSIIIAMLEIEGRHKKMERIESEERRKIWEEHERIERELKNRKDEEIKRFMKAFKKAQCHHHANILRAYVRTVESNAIKNDSLSEELKGWIIWATDKIEWFDPLIRHKDPLLDDDDRKTIYKYLVKESD